MINKKRCKKKFLLKSSQIPGLSSYFTKAFANLVATNVRNEEHVFSFSAFNILTIFHIPLQRADIS